MKKFYIIPLLVFPLLMTGCKDEEPVSPTLDSISVDSVVTEYYVGDDFIKPEVTAHYSDQTTKDVTDEATFSGYDMNIAGTYTVTVAYQSKTTSYEITISVFKTLNYITAENPRTEYMIGDQFEKPTILAHYSDESTDDVTSEAVFGGYNMNIANTYTVSVRYQNKFTSYEITVSPEPVLLDHIYASNVKSNYYVGDEFEKPTVIAVYSDDSEVDVTDDATFSGYNLNNAGSQTVTVTYNLKTTSFGITVTAVVVTSLELTQNETEFYEGDEFIKPTVTAKYNNNTSLDVTNDATFTGYNMDVANTYNVTVSYSGVSTTYTLVVLSMELKPVVTGIELREIVDEFTVGDTFKSAKVYALYNNDTEKDVTSSAEFTGYNMTIVGNYTVTATYLTFSKNYSITVNEKVYPTIKVEKDLNLATLMGKVNSLDGESRTYEEITFSFDKGEGQNPISSKDKGGYVALYQANVMTITRKGLTKVRFDYVNGKNGSIYVDEGGGMSGDDGETFAWSNLDGTDKVVFRTNAQVNFNAIHIEYNKVDKPDPIFDGAQTIAEVKAAAAEIEYTPNNCGWYLSTVEVVMEVEAIDAIDSTSTGKEYDGDARGKVLVCDETGYIICSSGVSTNNPISFYQRVKDYLKAGTTQYCVKGHIAFFNGVVEVKVSEYEYDSSLIIKKNYEGYVGATYTKSSEFTGYAKENIKTNDAGYGVGRVIRMTGLTLINEYNHQAGSDLFVDQEVNLVPVFSCLNKDRTQLVIGKCYDVIGLESRYKNRPSFRILKLFDSSLDAQEFDFRNNVTEVTNLKDFYNMGFSSNDNYVLSELTVYKADVYVSQYAADKYTFNTSYYYDQSYKEYTTGSSQVNAANHYALGIFNEDLDYKQTLLDFLINEAKDEDTVKSLRVTLYFTLAYLDTVDSKNMWRVNIFEDLVYGLDYYYSNTASMTFDVNEAGCAREDGKFQTWTNSFNRLEVTNSSNKDATIMRVTNYLKVVNNTSLTISFDHDIVAFTLYTGTYSKIAGLGSFSNNIKAYVQRGSYTLIILENKTDTIEIDHLSVSGADYLKVDSITVNY